jgi:hypothetical protein
MDEIALTACPVPVSLRATAGDSIDARFRLLSAATGRPLVLTGWSGSAGVYETTYSLPKHTLTVDVDQAGAGTSTTGLVTVTAAPGVTTTWITDGAWSLVVTDGSTSKTVVAGTWSATTDMQPAPFFCGGAFGSVGGARVGCLTAEAGCSACEPGCSAGTTYLAVALPNPVPGGCACS